MSALVKDSKSSNIHVDVQTAEGPKRISTRTPDRESAKIIGAALQKFVRANEGKKVTRVKVAEMAQALAKVVNTEQLESSPLKDILPVLTKQASLSDGDFRIKNMVTTRLIKFMEAQGLDTIDIWDVTSVQVGSFLSAETKARNWNDRSKRTYGQALGTVFEVALAYDLVPTNVVRNVKLPKRPKNSPHRPFTGEELVSTYFAGDQEWKEMLVCGSATGLRIGDESLLVVGDIDFETGFLRPWARKSDEFEPKPLPDWLLAEWKKRFEGKDPKEPLFPRAYGWMFIKGKVNSSRVSSEFVELLIRAGVRQRGKVRGVERIGANKYLPLSFQCLRHTYTTILKISNVSEAVARELVGHKSIVISDTYTHIDETVLKNAANRAENPLRELLATPVSAQMFLFDTGHVPLGTWIMRFANPRSSCKEAYPLPLEHVHRAGIPKILRLQESDRVKLANN